MAGREVVALTIFDHLEGDDLERVDRILVEAGKAAEEHIMRVAIAEHEGGDYPDDMAGPYCGCLTCDVRETLHAALPKLEEAVLVAWGLARNRGVTE